MPASRRDSSGPGSSGLMLGLAKLEATAEVHGLPSSRFQKTSNDPVYCDAR